MSIKINQMWRTQGGSIVKVAELLPNGCYRINAGPRSYRVNSAGEPISTMYPDDTLAAWMPRVFIMGEYGRPPKLIDDYLALYKKRDCIVVQAENRLSWSPDDFYRRAMADMLTCDILAVLPDWVTEIQPFFDVAKMFNMTINYHYAD